MHYSSFLVNHFCEYLFISFKCVDYVHDKTSAYCTGWSINRVETSSHYHSLHSVINYVMNDRHKIFKILTILEGILIHSFGQTNLDIFTGEKHKVDITCQISTYRMHFVSATDWLVDIGGSLCSTCNSCSCDVRCVNACQLFHVDKQRVAHITALHNATWLSVCQTIARQSQSLLPDSIATLPHTAHCRNAMLLCDSRHFQCDQ